MTGWAIGSPLLRPTTPSPPEAATTRFSAATVPMHRRVLQGNDEFRFVAGQATGDRINSFAGTGATAGDSLLFGGYGEGATFAQIDASHW